MPRSPENPRGLIATVAFFVGAGLLEGGLGLRALGWSPDLWEASGLAGRTALYFILAAALWRRVGIARSTAMVYCLASLVTYGFALGFAVARAPVPIPDAVIVQSLYEVPSCVLLLPYLRSAHAASLFRRPLLRHGAGEST